MAESEENNPRQRFKLSKNAVITAIIIAVVIMITITVLVVRKGANKSSSSASESSTNRPEVNEWTHLAVKNRVIDSQVNVATCRFPLVPTTPRPTPTTTAITINNTATTPTTTTTTTPTTTTDAAQTVTSSLKTAPVVGGEPVDDADVDRYPWMVRLLLRESEDRIGMCGGTLIDDLHILTAAHCFPPQFLNPVGILQETILGDIFVQMGGVAIGEFPNEEPGVEAGFVHQAFRKGSSWTNHDIAVLRLNRSLTRSPYWNGAIQPVCLPAESAQLPSQCEVIGWGKTNVGDQYAGSQRLQRLDVTAYSFPNCLNFKPFSGAGFLQASFDFMEYICSSTGPRGGRDVCFGDSGGPLLCKPATAGAGTEAAKKTNGAGAAEAKAGGSTSQSTATTTPEAVKGAGSEKKVEDSSSHEEITMQFGIASTTSAPCGSLPDFASFYSYVPFYRSWLRHVALPALQDGRTSTQHLDCLRRDCLRLNVSSFMMLTDSKLWNEGKGYLCRVFAAYVYCLQSDARPSRCRRTVVPAFYMDNQNGTAPISVLNARGMLLLFDIFRVVFVNVTTCFS